MRRTGTFRSVKGFTLLEMLLALSIAAVCAVFFAGFLIPQMEFYYDYDLKSQARAMCSEAFVELEEILEYGYMYEVDPQRPEEIRWYAREDGPGTLEDRENNKLVIPPSNTWSRLSAEDLDTRLVGSMSLGLDFSNTGYQEVRVRIQALKDGELVYEQEAVIHSLYQYHTVEGGSQ